MLIRPHDIPNWFWDILARADRDDDKLTDILEEMDGNQIRIFNDFFDEAVNMVSAPSR
jgi:hypothetical protein